MSSSKLLQPTTASLTVLFGIQGVCSQKAMLLRLIRTEPSIFGSSPRIAFSSEDLPQPVGPTMTVREPRGTWMLTSLSNGSASMLQPALTFSSVTAFGLLLLSCDCLSSSSGILIARVDESSPLMCNPDFSLRAGVACPVESLIPGILRYS